MIKHPHKQILLHVIFYINGANTGQFVDLPLTAVKISLGIFMRKARDKDYMWGTLGYIPAYSKHCPGVNTYLSKAITWTALLYLP